MQTKKTVFIHLVLFLVYLVLLGSSSFCFGQDYSGLEEFDNRFEGSTTKLISGSANMKLLSFVSYFQDFEEFKGQELKIRFQLEEATPINILVQQTKGNIIYRMKPKDFPLKQGLNQFEPWPVDVKLTQFKLKKNHLGITITDRSDNSVIYPAAIFHELDSLNFQDYLFKFLPHKSLFRIKFALYRGLYKTREINRDSLIHLKKLGERTKHGGEPFQLFIKKEDIGVDPNWQGWMTLEMTAKDAADYTDVQAMYFFYHSPDYKQRD